MPANGGMYKTIPQGRYAEALGRVDDALVVEEIKAAEAAIGRSPYEPEPRTAYRSLPSPEGG